VRLAGVDFTSAPRARKPITVASARGLDATRDGARLAVSEMRAFDGFEGWEAWLRTPGPWVAGFDFPFSFARAFVAAQGWPLDGDEPWVRIIRSVATLSRAELIARCRAWCDARAPGDKFAHRACEARAGSSASMKWVNPPVALMLHAGAPRLHAAGLTVPGLHERGTDPQRVALEAYPGALARAVLGRASYKSDDVRNRLDPARRAARERLVAALEAGAHPLAIGVDFGPWRGECIEEPGADRLDAVLCLAQAAWGWQRRDLGWGLPERSDRVEGWIVSAR
jgi:hypothetical protein